MAHNNPRIDRPPLSGNLSPSMANRFIRTFYLGCSCISSFFSSFCAFFMFLYGSIIFHVQPFFIELTYFLAVALIGSLTMTFLCKPKSSDFTPRYIDMFYMSISAVSLSGLNVIDMELFSESQIIILSLMVFISGEVFVCLLSLLFRRPIDSLTATSRDRFAIYGSGVDNMVVMSVAAAGGDGSDGVIDIVCSKHSSSIGDENENPHDAIHNKSIRFLAHVILAYISVFHVLGSLLVFVYLSVESSSSEVLRSKGLRSITFSIFTVISSFANNGLILANESLAPFKSNSGLLLMLVPMILCGNVQYPAFLRLVVWTIKRSGLMKSKQDEIDLILHNPEELKIRDLFPNLRLLLFQSMPAMGLLLTSIVLFGSMDWNAPVLSGLTSYQKLVGLLFQSVSVRHAGESIFDTSAIAAAVLVFFLLLMYLPAYTLFVPMNGRFQKSGAVDSHGSNSKINLVKKTINISQSSYLFMFAIIACIIERNNMKMDPHNFTIFNVIFETVSAYGNVGLSMGYSCGKRLIGDGAICVDTNYSFSGRWSDRGKWLIIVVMLFGRLKKYHMGGAKAWRLT